MLIGILLCSQIFQDSSTWTKIDELKSESGEAWRELHQGFRNAWNDLKQGWQRATAKFSH